MKRLPKQDHDQFRDGDALKPEDRGPRGHVTIGFTGTRKGMTERQAARLEEYLRMYQRSFGGRVEFCHGGAIGADSEADDIARTLHIPRIVRPALAFPMQLPEKRMEDLSKVFGGAEILGPKSDPLARNKDIVNASAYMLAIPARMKEELRSGTWATIRFARSKRKHVVIAWPDGSQLEQYMSGSIYESVSAPAPQLGGSVEKTFATGGPPV